MPETDLAYSAEEKARATDPPAADFPLVDDQDTLEDGVDLLVAQTPATPHQAILNMRAMRENHTPIGDVGMCLYNIRHFAWQVAAMWPNANEEAAHGAPVHRFKTFAEVPRGMTVVYVNNHLGHIVLGLGSGLCDTSDYHEPGFNSVATLANVADWCGATDWFGIETVEGVDVWPNPKKPTPPAPLSLAEKIAVLRHRERELKAGGHDRRAARLELWIAHLEKRAAS